MSFPAPPRRPTPGDEGANAESIFMQMMWDLWFDPKVNIFVQSDDIKVDKTPKGYEIKISKFPPGGRRGWHFEDKIEVDNTKSYPKQTVIHIQDTHSLVTAGIRDAADPDGGLVTACAGFWVSTQAVPAKTTVDGNDVWNLPQYPYPEPTDMDDPANFWIYLGEVIAC